MNLVGCDVFVYSKDGVAPQVPKENGPLRLELIANRATKVWPATAAKLDYFADEWRCRFTSEGDKAVEHKDIDALVRTIGDGGHFWTRVQVLWLNDDGSRAFSSPY